MKVRLQLRYEDGGRPIGKWRDSFVHNLVLPTGTFQLCTDFVRELNSHVMKARFDPEDGKNAYALYRAQILYIKDDCIAVTGLEHDPVSNKYTAQTWHLAVLSPA